MIDLNNIAQSQTPGTVNVSWRLPTATALDSVEAFRQAMVADGLETGNIMADGTLHRFHVTGDRPRTENGWYVLHLDPPAGSYGCWKRNISRTWRGREYRTLTPEEKARYAANMEAAKHQREEAEAIRHEEARQEAARRLPTLQPAPLDHPYLVRKGILSHDMLLDHHGNLVVTMRDIGGTLRGWETIAPDGTKRRLTGTDPKGAFHVLGDPTTGSGVMVCEGYATGASIHEATGMPVICAFSSNNLLEVARAWRGRLSDARITICGDNDEHGKGQEAARIAADAIGGRLVLPLKAGTDFNDLAVAEGPEAVRRVIEVPAVDTIVLSEWCVENFTAGTPPEEPMLVTGRFPLGKPAILAAQGETGKGFLLLDLAIKVAYGCGVLKHEAFGGLVDAEGPAVILAAEDDAATIHRRVSLLDPAGLRFKYRGRLIVVPLPNAASSLPLLMEINRQGTPRESDTFKRLADEMGKLQPKLLSLDPLQPLFPADFNKPEYAQFVASLLCRLAAQTGACVIGSHHMRKTSSDITTLAEARDAIRGSGAAVDGVRSTYALWPAAESAAKTTCKKIKIPYTPNRVVFGGVCKANGAADRCITTYIRNDFGLLVDKSFELKGVTAGQAEQDEALIAGVAQSAAAGRPFTRTGQNGVGQRRHELPEVLHGLGRDRVEAIAGRLLDSGKIVAALAGGTTVKWLDVPDGPFAKGCGIFEAGASARK